LIEETDLLKKILDTANEGSKYRHQSQAASQVNLGFMPFIRKLANKLHNIQTESNEVANLLESIPEWAGYVEEDLKRHNEIESKPLG
jgi:SIT4 phosphatase-associated protein